MLSRSGLPDTRFWSRALDLVLDPRLPHGAPAGLLRWLTYTAPSAPLRLDEPLHVCLTFDIEHDFRDPDSHGSAYRFMQCYPEWAQRHGLRSTLYVQGSLAPMLAATLRQAAPANEIGLHGLYHEVWGRSRWWQYRLGLAAIASDEKRRRIQQAIDLFADAGLPRPRSFRAPYLNIDADTLRQLRQAGFSSDSSPATYLGAPPVPRYRRGIWQIPLSADPRPRWANGLIAAYRDGSLGSLAGLSEAAIGALVDLALAIQQRRPTGFPPHIVILAHPWEFEQTAGVAHASLVNWALLKRIITTLSARYELTFSTITELVQWQAKRMSGAAARAA